MTHQAKIGWGVFLAALFPVLSILVATVPAWHVYFPGANIGTEWLFGTAAVATAGLLFLPIKSWLLKAIAAVLYLPFLLSALTVGSLVSGCLVHQPYGCP